MFEFHSFGWKVRGGEAGPPGLSPGSATTLHKNNSHVLHCVVPEWICPIGGIGNSEGESGLKGQKCLRKYEAKLQVGKGRVIKAILYIESIFLGNPS